MKIKINIIFTALIIVLSAALISGCGGGGGSAVSNTVFDSGAQTGGAAGLSDDKISLAMVDNSVKTANRQWKPAETSVSKAVKSGIPFSNFLGHNGISSPGFSGGLKHSPALKSNLPSKFNWRDRDGINWNTSVKCQGYFGTCVAFAAIAALETQIRIKNNNPSQMLDLSELHLFYNGGGNFYSGWYFNPALEYLKSQGTVPESKCPYGSAPGHNEAACKSADKIKINDYAVLSRGDDSIKSALIDGPVITSMTVYQDFKYYNGSLYEHLPNFTNENGQIVANRISGSHAVLIVGYNDGQGCWYIKNSWGTEWGDEGYFRIKYGDCNIGANDAFSIILADDPEPHIAPVTGLELAGVYDSGVKLKWCASAGAAGYNVYVNDIPAVTVKDISAEILNLSPDTNYSITVTAFNSKEESAKSTAVNARTTAVEWKVEPVYWIVNYGNNYSNCCGYITKAGAARIKVRFKEIRMEENCDFLSIDGMPGKYTGAIANVVTGELTGGSMTLAVTSDSENHYFFIIDQIIWQGSSDVPAAKSGILFDNKILNEKPAVSNFNVNGSSGLISISFSLADADNDACSLKVYYSADNGNSYLPTANITGQTAGVAPGFDKVIYWNSDADIKNNINSARLKIIANDGKEDGNAAESKVFAANNMKNISRPVISNLRADYDAGKFYITYGISDVENDLSNLKVYYSLNDNKNYKITASVTGDLANVSTGPGKLIIFSPMDKEFAFQEAGPAKVYIKLIPCDTVADGVGYEIMMTVPRAVYNEKPAVKINSLDIIGREIRIKYNLTDKENDDCTVEVYYSAGGNKNYKKTVNIEEGSPFPRDGATALSEFTSYFRIDNEAVSTGACELYIKLVPSDYREGTAGEKSILLGEEFMNHSPTIDFEYVSASYDRVCVRGMITDKVSADCKLEIFYSADGADYIPIKYNDPGNYNMIPFADKEAASYLIVPANVNANIYFNAGLNGLKLSETKKLMLKFAVSDGCFNSEAYCVIK